MRGVYTIGVLDLFMDRGLYLDHIYAVSAGACQGLSYVSRQRGRSFKVVHDYIGDPRYLSYRNMITEGGLFGMDFGFREIPQKYVLYDFDTFERYKRNFNVCVTNCLTGEAEYINSSSGLDMFTVSQASSSMPLVSKEVLLNGVPYLDGGIADSIPIFKSERDGFKKHIAVLTRHAGYRKEAPKRPSTLMKMRYRKYPNLLKTHYNRANVYNESLDRLLYLESIGEAIIIRPAAPVTIKRTEKNLQKLTQFYNEGYEDAARAFERIMEFISS